MVINRKLEKKILDLAEKFPVISITGPRQSGKTTLAKLCFPDYNYINLELPHHRIFAQEDPEAFLKGYRGGLILDEAQYAPELFSYIQGIVDESGETGQFILTGSQNFLLLEKITQSLAGRVAILHLLPFSNAELKNTVYQEENLNELLFKGSYPPLYDKLIEPIDFYQSYVQSYIERDVRNILNVSNLNLFRTFMGIVAGRTGQILNITSISNDLGLDSKTIRSWLSVLETSFIIYLIRPHHKNYNKRLIKSPKLYFYDTGLACSLLGIRNASEIQNHYLKGALFENFVFTEISKYYYHQGIKPELFFWRDNIGNEVDCIVRDGIQSKIIEIKSAQTINSVFFKGIHYYQKISGIEAKYCYLIYGGNENQHRTVAQVLSWQNMNSLFTSLH